MRGRLLPMRRGLLSMRRGLLSMRDAVLSERLVVSLAGRAFKNKTVDIYFTRDNIYLRLMENQRVRDVRSLYSILCSVTETSSPIQDLKAISMFPGYQGEMASIEAVYRDVAGDNQLAVPEPVKKKQGILAFFHL